MFRKYYNSLYEYFQQWNKGDWPLVPAYPDKLFDLLMTLDEQGIVIALWYVVNVTLCIGTLITIAKLPHPAEFSMLDFYKEGVLWGTAYSSYILVAYLTTMQEHYKLLEVLGHLERTNAMYAEVIYKQSALLNGLDTLSSKTSINSYFLFIDPYDKLYHATQVLPSTVKPVTRLIQLSFDDGVNPLLIEFVIQKSPLMDYVNITMGIGMI